jgi:hypothetical protein
LPNRIIKESICTSDNLNELSDKEEIFFYRVLVNCDDYGIMDARTAILRSKCFPLRLENIKDKDIEQWLKALCNKNLVFLYNYEGRRYLKMTSWDKHQQIRASKSKYPTPDLEGVELISFDINRNQPHANVPVIQSNPNLYSICYAPQVKLSQEEFEKLNNSFGEEKAKDYIERLNDYILQIGIDVAKRKYRSHYATIKNWERKDRDKNKDKPTPPHKKTRQELDAEQNARVDELLRQEGITFGE